MERRVLDDESAIPHAVVDPHDGVTGSAGQTGLRFRSMKLVFDGFVKSSVEEDRMIMTAGTPFGRLNAVYILHVLDRLPVPLIVKRREVVHGGVPLFVNVG